MSFGTVPCDRSFKPKAATAIAQVVRPILNCFQEGSKSHKKLADLEWLFGPWLSFHFIISFPKAFSHVLILYPCLFRFVEIRRPRVALSDFAILLQGAPLEHGSVAALYYGFHLLGFCGSNEEQRHAASPSSGSELLSILFVSSFRWRVLLRLTRGIFSMTSLKQS